MLSLMITVSISSCNPRKAHVIGKVLHEIDQLAGNEYEESYGNKHFCVLLVVFNYLPYIWREIAMDYVEIINEQQ